MERATTLPLVDSEPRVRQDRRRILASLTAVHTVNDFYGVFLPPLLPVLRQAFALTYAQAGVVPFVTTGLSAVFQPTLGYLADRHMIRRTLMIAGFLTIAVAVLAIGVANSYPLLLLGAALLGLGASTYHPQSATFLLHYFSDKRGRAQGIHGIGNGLGFALAPLTITALIARIGYQYATVLLALPALAAAFIVGRTLREPTTRGSQGFLAGLTRPLLLLTLVNGLALAANTGYLTWLPSYYTSRGHTIVMAGVLTALMSSASLIAQPLGGTLSDRLGRRNLITISSLGVGTFLLLFLLAPTETIMVPLSIMIGFFSHLMPPVVMVYASELAAGERTGLSVGTTWGAGTAISSTAPLLAGVTIDAAGFEVAYLGLATVALIGAVLSRGLPDQAGSGRRR